MIMHPEASGVGPAMDQPALGGDSERSERSQPSEDTALHFAAEVVDGFDEVAGVDRGAAAHELANKRRPCRGRRPRSR